MGGREGLQLQVSASRISSDRMTHPGCTASRYKGQSSPEGRDGLRLRSFLLWGRNRLRGKQRPTPQGPCFGLSAKLKLTIGHL